MAKPTSNKVKIDTEFIKPIIRVDGQQHILEKIMTEDADQMPVLKSVGYMKMNSGQHSWMSYVITTKGKEVLSIEASEPDMRAIAEEAAKISFVDCFIDSEL